jgi:hypothetical protein
VPVIERYLGVTGPGDVSVDDRRNEPELYRELMQDRDLLDDCLSWLFAELRAISYEQSGQILAGLIFLQWVVADGLWRYRQPVSERLERFTRDNDRLDISDERRRLYDWVKDGEKLD